MATRNPRAKPASRPSVRHPSHGHPLRLSKAKDEDEIICSGCELELIGPAYKCTKSDCDYFLHKSCLQLPLETLHKSHPDHPLALVYSAPYVLSVYTCDACGECGSGFAYHCSICQYDLHIGCASMAETVEREDHDHPLTLLYCSPCKDYANGATFTCDVCQEIMPENRWLYYCKECDYGTHIHSCAAEEEEERREEEEEEQEQDEEAQEEAGGEESSTASAISSMLDAQREMSMMHFRTQMAMQQAQMIRDMGRSLANLAG